MKIEPKDVIHFYLGCEVEIEVYGKIRVAILLGIDQKYFHIKMPGDISETRYLKLRYPIKPILRPLSDMTEEEKFYNEEVTTAHSSDKVRQRQLEAVRTAWLLKQGFDLFGLIESGQAIDKSTLK